MALLFSRIKEMREAAGLSQVKLAKKIGSSEMTVRRWENAQRSPSGDALIRLADALNTNVSYLLDESDDPSPISGKFKVRIQFLNKEEDVDFDDVLYRGMTPTLPDDKTPPREETTKPLANVIGMADLSDTPLQAEIIKAVRGIDDPDKLRKILEHTSDQLKLENFEKVRGA